MKTVARVTHVQQHQLTRKEGQKQKRKKGEKWEGEKREEKRKGTKLVETRKDVDSPAIRRRLCATEVSTGEPRYDTSAATLILSWAATGKPKRVNAPTIIVVFACESAQGDLRGATKGPSQDGEDLEIARVSAEVVTQVKCLRRSWRKDSTNMASREIRCYHVCAGV